MLNRIPLHGSAWKAEKRIPKSITRTAGDFHMRVSVWSSPLDQ